MAEGGADRRRGDGPERAGHRAALEGGARPQGDAGARGEGRTQFEIADLRHVQFPGKRSEHLNRSSHFTVLCSC